jgi:hypothetical protein
MKSVLISVASSDFLNYLLQKFGDKMAFLAQTTASFAKI